jgi:uncharacterized lipoprotein YajG
MKVVRTISVVLFIAAVSIMFSGCGSKTSTTAVGNPSAVGSSDSTPAVGGPGALMTMKQKQQAVENSSMSPEAKQAWEQAAARAAVQQPPIPKNP